MLLRQNGRAGCHPANQRQHQLRGARQRQVQGRALGGVQGAHRTAAQANAARGATDQLDHAFAGQRLQVFFGGVGRFEAHFSGNFSARGRRARVADGALDQIQNLLLSGSELGRRGHGGWVQMRKGG